MILLLLLVGAVLFYSTDFEKGQALANGQPYTNLADVKTIYYPTEEEASCSSPPLPPLPPSLPPPLPCGIALTIGVWWVGRGKRNSSSATKMTLSMQLLKGI